jgi:hypothetical protein
MPGNKDWAKPLPHVQMASHDVLRGARGTSGTEPRNPTFARAERTWGTPHPQAITNPKASGLKA